MIRHIGMSSHNPKVARKAAESGYVEMILFSINPPSPMRPQPMPEKDYASVLAKAPAPLLPR